MIRKPRWAFISKELNITNKYQVESYYIGITVTCLIYIINKFHTKLHQFIWHMKKRKLNFESPRHIDLADSVLRIMGWYNIWSVDLFSIQSTGSAINKICEGMCHNMWIRISWITLNHYCTLKSSSFFTFFLKIIIISYQYFGFFMNKSQTNKYMYL